MVLVCERQHPGGLSFAQQRRVWYFRHTQGLSWQRVAERVRSRRGGHPSWKSCARVFAQVTSRKERKAYHYNRCGQKRVKFTKAMDKFLARRLLALRGKVVCTAAVLQAEAARKMGVSLELSGIRKALRRQGFSWQRRSQKRKYSAVDMQARLDFANDVVALGARRLRTRLAFAMDGIVLSVPPRDPIARANHCHGADKYMWRRSGEAADPKLAGRDLYAAQCPAHRTIALWGGISADGFAEVLVGKRKKQSAEEWAEMVDAGKLKTALARVNPAKPTGPWTILCDNERFLRAPEAVAAHRSAKVTLWKMPPRSPDLNPVEKYWSWLRRQLLQEDLADLSAGRPPLEYRAYLARVRRINRSARARRVAGKCAQGLLKVCREVVAKGGAATRG